MRTRQYAYFAVRSTTRTAAEIGARLGLEADRVLVRGSKATTPRAIPAAHEWSLRVETEAGDQIDAPIAKLIARLAPIADGLAALARDGDPGVLQLVRNFDVEDGDDDALGWHLDPATVGFLASIGAAIDVDEYG